MSIYVASKYLHGRTVSFVCNVDYPDADIWVASALNNGWLLEYHYNPF